MLLQQIVQELDGELARLQALRQIVAGLAGPSAVAADFAPRLADLLGQEEEVSAEPRRRGRPRKVSPEEAEPEPKPRPRARVFGVVRRAARRREVEANALSKATSAGPVVVSAAALVREREHRAAAKAAAEAGQPLPAPEVRPESFAQELSARWLGRP